MLMTFLYHTTLDGEKIKPHLSEDQIKKLLKKTQMQLIGNFLIVFVRE
jgi:hypothetical protein